MAVMKLNCWLY